MTENRHTCNMCVDDDALTVRLEALKQLKQERQQEIEDRLKARKDAAEETRRDGAVKKQCSFMATKTDPWCPEAFYYRLGCIRYSSTENT